MAYKYEEDFKELCEEVALRLNKEGLEFTTMQTVNGEIVIYSMLVAPEFGDCEIDIFMNNHWETSEHIFFLFRVINDPYNIDEVPDVGYATIDSLIKTIKSRRELLGGVNETSNGDAMQNL